MNTKLITLGSVNWWFMKGFWRSISLKFIQNHLHVYTWWTIIIIFLLSNIYFFHSCLLFLRISELGNNTHIILLHVKEIRHPRSGEFDNSLHMSTCAHFKDVNHSLGELPLWKWSDFLQEFVRIARTEYQCLLTPVSPINT